MASRTSGVEHSQNRAERRGGGGEGGLKRNTGMLERSSGGKRRSEVPGSAGVEWLGNV